MKGRGSKTGARQRPWLQWISCLTLAGCAARPVPPAETASSAAAQSSASDLTTSSDSKSDPTEARTFGWLSLTVGAEAAVVATVTSVIMLDDKSTRSSDCNAEKVCSSSGFTANTQIGSFAGWNAGAWVVAAAGLGLGSYLLITHPPAKRTPALTLGPGSATLEGTF
jgi:hypothetical protein